MTKAIIGIGIPRSGKSEVLRQLASHDSAYISATEIRSQMYQRGSDQSLTRVVWDEIFRLIHECLRAGRNVVIDASNARVEDRRELAVHCRQYAREVIGVWFNTPLETCLERNRQLGKNKIPEYAIRQMAQELKWYPPSHSDGFDHIMVVSA